MPHLHLNLASDPFRRDRGLFVFSVAVAGLLSILLVTLIGMAIVERGRAEEARNEMARLEKIQRQQQADLARLEGVLRQSNNAEVLERSVFLNTLIRRKGISWTRLFGDLATVMPPDVRLVAVRPQVAGENQLLLDMTVASAAAAPVVNLLGKLEGSPVFGSTEVLNFRPPGQSETHFTYRITVNYNQKL